MSIDTTRIHCTGCDYEYFEHYQPIKLKSAFGSGVVTYYRTKSWCHECGGIKDAEFLPSITRLKRELRCLRGKGFTGWLRCLLPSHRSQIKEMQNTIEWRLSRKSPPRCLHCGTTNISLLVFRPSAESTAEARGFRHACGGSLVHDFTEKTGTRFFFSEKIIWLDSEGNQAEARH